MEDETEIRSTATELRAVKKELRELRVEVAVITACIEGDKKLNPPRPGIMDYLQTHKDDLYGNEETQHKGLKGQVESHDARIEVLEDTKKKLLWTWGGISLGTGTAIGVILWLIEWLAKKP